jgi:hypothetical protein
MLDFLTYDTLKKNYNRIKRVPSALGGKHKVQEVQDPLILLIPFPNKINQHKRIRIMIEIKKVENATTMLLEISKKFRLLKPFFFFSFLGSFYFFACFYNIC